MIKKSFSTKNSKLFTTWLKRFSSISDECILEINFDNNEFIIKSHKEDRSVVKQSKISFESVDFYTNESEGYMKAGIRVLPKLIKMIDSFNSEEFTITFVADDDTDECTLITVNNKTLKIKVICASLSTMIFISDEMFSNISTPDENSYGFMLSNNSIEKIKATSAFDSAVTNPAVCFSKTTDKLVARGESFELIIDDSVTTSEVKKLYVSQEQFSKLDVENYNVQICEDKLVCTSLDTSSVTVIAKFDI